MISVTHEYAEIVAGAPEFAESSLQTSLSGRCARLGFGLVQVTSRFQRDVTNRRN